MKKKLFTLLTALVLSMGIGWAATKSQHFDYSEVTTARAVGDNGSGNWYMRVNVIEFVAQKSNNDVLQLYFSRTSDSNYGLYSGNLVGPYPGTYPLYKSTYNTQYGLWVGPANVNAVWVYNTYSNGYGSTKTGLFSAVRYSGTIYQIRYGNVIVKENNVGKLFMESDADVTDYNGNNTIYFSFGNRSENTLNLGTGTMNLAASSITMSASSGSTSANIKLNAISAGLYSKSSFDLSNSSFTYNGSAKTISDISATITISAGIYTMVATIRDNKDNVYFVTLSAAQSTTPTVTINTPTNGSIVVKDANNKTITSGMQVEEGTVLTVTATPATDCLFSAWTGDITTTSTSGNVVTGTITVDNSVTIGATFTECWKYTIEILPNTGSGLITITDVNTGVVYYNDHVTKDILLPKSCNVSIVGKPDAGSKVKFAYFDSNYYTTEHTFTSSYSITAANRWTFNLEKITRTVTITTPVEGLDIAVTKKDGGAVNSGGQVEDGTVLVFTATENNVHFNEWKVNNTALTSSTNPMEYTVNGEDITLTATSKVRCTFTADPKAGGTVTTNQGSVSPRDVNYAVNVRFSATNNPGYHFVNWTRNDVEKTTETSFIESVKADVNCVAHFAPNIHTLTWAGLEDATLSGTYTVAGDVAYGTALVAPTVERDGYNFLGWKDAEGNVTPTITATMPDEDVTYTAQWEKATTTVTVAATEHGTIIVTDEMEEELYNDRIGGSFEVAYGAQLNLSYTEDDYYAFVDWHITGDYEVVETPKESDAPRRAPMIGDDDDDVTISDGNNSVLTIVVNGAVTIDAEFEYVRVYTMALDLDELTTNGTISLSYNGATYTEHQEYEIPEGTEVTLELTPGESGNQKYPYNGGEFWDADELVVAHEGLTWTFTMTRDMSVYGMCYIDRFVMPDTYASDAEYNALPWGLLIRRLVLNRSFKAKTWSTMCLPFDCILEGYEMEGMIYKLEDATFDSQSNKITVDFGTVGEMKAGTPYMLYSKTAGSNPVFDYVTLDEGAVAKDTTINGVSYIGVLGATPTHLEAFDNTVRFISSNKLYYPSTGGTSIVHDRAYFTLPTHQGVAPRLSIRINGETLEEADDETMMETGVDKYISNGILYIHRNGTTYNAQGQKID